MTASTRALRRAPLAMLVVLLGGALGVTAQATAQDSPVEGTPRLVVEESTHDWGQLLKGQATEYTFSVRNDGDGALLIEKVQAT